MTARRTTEEVKEIVESLGYELIDEYVEKNSLRVTVKDSDRYKYDVILDSLKKYSPQFVSISNPFVLENIPRWLEINNKTFKLSENNVYLGNNKKLFFSCDVCPEEFDSTWANVQSHSRGCPYCSGKRVGRFNNLEYLRPDLAREWNYDRNTLLPSEVTLGLGKKVWWLCEDGHEWEATINSRTNGNGCPYCSGRFATDKNRLSLHYPEIVSEWHPTKNGELTPHDVSFGSDTKVWWLCDEGHEWETTIGHRTNGRGCPKCKLSKGAIKISRFLQFNNIPFAIEKYFEECRDKGLLPFDFYLPDYGLLIEYHGLQHYEPVDFAGYGKKWAEDQFKGIQRRDQIKEKFCHDNNIPLKIIPYWEFDNIEKILTETLSL